MAEITDAAAADDAVPGTQDLSEVRTRAELGAVLERLRARSGRSLRDLAQEISSDTASDPIGFSALGDWCRGARLPLPSRYGVFTRLLRQLGVTDPEPWIAALVRVRDTPARRSGSGGPAPYPGLKAFAQDDAHRFFGRDDLVDQAVARFRQVLTSAEGPRMLWVVGASGAGKSSLLHAGLCPHVAELGHVCLPMTPGAHPLDALAELLADRLEADRDSVVTGLRNDPKAWSATVAGRPSPGGAPLVVVVDQFEELFRECRDESEQEAFLAALDTLTAPDSALPCVMVASLRSDFYADATARTGLVRSLQNAQILVSPLDRTQLTDAIVEPARQVGTSIDKNLVALLLRDFIPTGSIEGRHDPGALPLLAHALLETWKHARRGRMTVDDYARSGGVGRAIEESAERIHTELSVRDQAQVRQIFVRLVHLEDDGVATRRAASYAELEGLDRLGDDGSGPHSDGATWSSVGDILDRFVESRLLTAYELTVEIAHESLLTAWPRLGSWIEEDREALRAHRRITEATRAWMDADRDPSMLASGVRLEAMQSWAATESPNLRLTNDEHDFISLSHARAEEVEDARRRQTRRLRLLATVAAVCALLAGALAVVTDHARDDAITARDEALSRQIALNVRDLRETDPSLAAQLAVVGYRIAPTSEARSTVLDASVTPAGTRYLGGLGSTALVLSERGGLLAVSNSADRTVQLFTVSPEGLQRAGLVRLGAPEFEIYALALTPDDRTLVVGDSSAEITLWDVSNPDRPQRLGEPLNGPTGPIQTLALSPDGHELAAVGEGDGAFRWDIDDPGHPEPLPLLGSPGVTWGVAYDPRGGRAVVSDDTGQVQIWDITDAPRREHSLRIGDRPVFDVAFSPDGHTLVAGSKSGALVAWDVATPSRPTRLDIPDSTFDSWVNTTAFSPDGAYLAAGSSDLDVRIWDTSTWTPVQTLLHPAALTQVAFSHDSRSIISAATDGVTRVWDIRSNLRPTMAGLVWNVSITPDGQRLAAFSGEESRIWDTADLAGPALTQMGTPDGADDPITGAGDLSPDGQQIALGARLGAVYLVDVTDPARPRLIGRPLGGSEAQVETVAFSPDGKLLAAGGQDTNIRVWDISDPERPRRVAVLDAPTEMVLYLAWSPDGDQLAAASADNDVYLYDVGREGRPQLLTQLGGFDSEAYTAAFSPDGQVLATGGSEATVILWDISTPTTPQQIGEPITGPVARVYDLSFDKQGNRLAAAVIDGTTWVWDTRDLRSPERTAVLGPADGAMYTTLFTPDGDTLVGAGGDGQIRVWDMDVEAVIRHICATAGDPITKKEWRVYLRTTPYTPPCP